MKKVVARADVETPTAGAVYSLPATVPVPLPHYLEQTYWWAYLHPRGVRFFERQWLVNLILLGNYRRLRDAALAELDARIGGCVLQVACVYGDFTERVANRLADGGHLDVVDVAPVQLENLQRKIGPRQGVTLHHRDSTRLGFPDAAYDCVVVFFLLHEQPDEARVKTLAEAMRVVRPGGKVVIVDYHRPVRANPFRYLMPPLLALLEPFALALWRREIVDWLAPDTRFASLTRQTFFGGLYQKTVIIR